MINFDDELSQVIDHKVIHEVQYVKPLTVFESPLIQSEIFEEYRPIQPYVPYIDPKPEEHKMEVEQEVY